MDIVCSGLLLLVAIALGSLGIVELPWFSCDPLPEDGPPSRDIAHLRVLAAIRAELAATQVEPLPCDIPLTCPPPVVVPSPKDHESYLRALGESMLLPEDPPDTDEWKPTYDLPLPVTFRMDWSKMSSMGAATACLPPRSEPTTPVDGFSVDAPVDPTHGTYSPAGMAWSWSDGSQRFYFPTRALAREYKTAFGGNVTRL